MEDFTQGYLEKKKEKRIEFEFALNGIAVIERGFDPVTGLPLLKQTQITNSQHIADLTAEDEKRLAEAAAAVARIEANIADKKALQKDVAAKEIEREKLEKAKK